MKTKEAIKTDEMIAIIVTLFVGLLFVIILMKSGDKDKTDKPKAPVQQTSAAFPYKIKFNEYGAAYYMVPLMADGMAYGIVPIPVIGPDGVNLTNKDIKTNN